MSLLLACAFTEPLDGVHDVGLLRQHRVAELLRPVEFLAHHVEHVGGRSERLHAVVPVLAVDRGFESVALQVLVGTDPAVGLDDFERIGRGHEDFREQRVGIERDRSDQRIELSGGQQLLRRRRSRLRRRRCLRRCQLRQRQQQRDGQEPQCQLDHDRLPVLATFARAIFTFVLDRTLSAFAPACPEPPARFPWRRRWTLINLLSATLAPSICR